MNKVLHIISSPRGDQSYSKGLSTAIIQKLQQQGMVDTVVEKDLTQDSPPLFDTDLVQEFYKYPGTSDQKGEQLLAYSTALFAAINDADITVISTPMHNFGISAALKAWIDQLVRFGITYTYDNEGKRVGIFKNKKIYLAIALGGSSTGVSQQNEFIETYIKAVFREYVGITDVDTYRVENTAQPNFVVDYDAIIENL